jgi:hypothetical protein
VDEGMARVAQGVGACCCRFLLIHLCFRGSPLSNAVLLAHFIVLCPVLQLKTWC